MEKQYILNMTMSKLMDLKRKKNHVLTVCYNGSNSYIILNGVQQAKIKAMTNL